MPDKTLGLIHTSFVFITKETMMSDLFAELLPDVKLINIVDDSLLPQCMGVGQVTPALTRRMCAYVRAAQEAGADAVLSLCSSLGPAIDVARRVVDIPVIKIDDAMTDQAVAQASRIGVMATVPTTLGPTVGLIEGKAATAGKTVTVTSRLVAGAFEKLMAGDSAAHDSMVMEAAADLASQVELIVFAQASMTRLAEPVASHTRRTVLTSPRLGIELARRVLDQRATGPLRQ
jgi:Asp/Glu/hydantoin racemase